MSKLCEITANGQRFLARPGDLLLDAAQMNGVDVPYDCRSGRCGACIVRLLEGQTIGGEGAEPGTVHACQARVLSDVCIAFDAVPPARTWKGRVVTVNNLTDDVVEVTVLPSRQPTYLPGQHLRLQFVGFPERAYSPTLRLDNPESDGRLRFHIKRIPEGQVSARLGSEIAPGHRVRMRGPYGSAYLRRALPNRLVLIAGGTGFAPIWSIADAALAESSVRPIVLVIGVRALQSLYMAEALHLLATCSNVTAVIASEEPQHVTRVIRTGRASEFLPDLGAEDFVYAAGPNGLVDAVTLKAQAAGAQMHANPFLANGPHQAGWLDRLMSRRRRSSLNRPPLASGQAPSGPQLMPVPEEQGKAASSFDLIPSDHRI